MSKLFVPTVLLSSQFWICNFIPIVECCIILFIVCASVYPLLLLLTIFLHEDCKFYS